MILLAFVWAVFVPFIRMNLTRWIDARFVISRSVQSAYFANGVNGLFLAGLLGRLRGCFCEPFLQRVFSPDTTRI